jgi:cytidylate kinase
MKSAPLDKPLIVTIDGPAGAGKTTVSKMLAARLGYRYIDTGALYRGVALAVKGAGIAADDDQAITRLCASIDLDWVQGPRDMRLTLDGIDVGDRIRDPEISMLASAVSARKPVRDALMRIQRHLGSRKRVVLEGRDMGTVVFPEAEVKFFLDADLKVRAQRRHAELCAKSPQAPTLAAVEIDMARRDRDDSSRALAPLKAAADAIRIDSTALTIEEVVDQMTAFCRRVR